MRAIKGLRHRFSIKTRATGLLPGCCILWTAPLNAKGYGQIGLDGVAGGTRKAHRVAYELAYGAIPAGALVLHRCRVKHCVAPEHLYLGDYHDARAVRGVRGLDMSEAEAAAVSALVAIGVLEVREIAKAFHMSVSAVRLAVKGGLDAYPHQDHDAEHHRATAARWLASRG